MGEFNILYKNSNDEWTELHKIEENENITPRDQWETLTLSTSENNYGIKIRHNKKIIQPNVFNIKKKL